MGFADGTWSKSGDCKEGWKAKLKFRFWGSHSIEFKPSPTMDHKQSPNSNFFDASATSMFFIISVKRGFELGWWKMLISVLASSNYSSFSYISLMSTQLGLPASSIAENSVPMRYSFEKAANKKMHPNYWKVAPLSRKDLIASKSARKWTLTIGTLNFGQFFESYRFPLILVNKGAFTPYGPFHSWNWNKEIRVCMAMDV